MVSGLTLTTSATFPARRLESGSGFPPASTHDGLGRTAFSTIWVAGVSPAGVFGLQPVGLCIMPKETERPATAMYVTGVVVLVLAPAEEQPTRTIPRATLHRTALLPHPGRRPRGVTAAEDPGSAWRR